mmetsp:Transcript_74978/g.150746  ORF Transcript_74978/g.150746 Transcript_74978/m.150746 type:complete len:224 (-) Transcript_74978:267-938(-)
MSCAACFAPASAKCAKCQEVSYCGRDCQLKHWKDGHKKLCKGNPPKSMGTEAAAGPVFAEEAEMLAQMRAMGMPEQMLANLTKEQKEKMFAMTRDKSIVAKASANVEAQKSGAEMGFEGRSADGSAVPAPGGLYSWADEKPLVRLEVECPVDTKKSDVKVAFKADSISVKVGALEVLNGPLFQDVDPAKCTWVLDLKPDTAGKILCITLTKKAPMRWLQIIRK